MLVPYTIGEVKFTVPTTWNDVTLKQWFDLETIDTTDPFSLLSVISSVDRETWVNCRDMDIETKLMPNLMFLTKPINLSALKKPATVTIGDIKYKVPSKLTQETLGQKIIFEKEMSKHLNPKGEVSSKFAPMALAIYLKPKDSDGKWRDDGLKQLADSMLTGSITETWPTASFFLRTFLKSFKTTKH